jgi:hypothetical protein
MIMKVNESLVTNEYSVENADKEKASKRTESKHLLGPGTWFGEYPLSSTFNTSMHVLVIIGSSGHDLSGAGSEADRRKGYFVS